MDEGRLRRAQPVQADRSGVPARVTVRDGPSGQPIWCGFATQRSPRAAYVARFATRRSPRAAYVVAFSGHGPGLARRCGRTGACLLGPQAAVTEISPDTADPAPTPRLRTLGLRVSSQRPRVSCRTGFSSRSAAAGPSAAAAPCTRGRRRRRSRRGCAATARDRDCGQQLHRVLVALRTGRRDGRLPHRAGQLKGVAAGAAPVLVSRHSHSLGRDRDRVPPGGPRTRPTRSGDHRAGNAEGGRDLRRCRRSGGCPQGVAPALATCSGRVVSTRGRGAVEFGGTIRAAPRGAVSGWPARQLRRGPREAGPAPRRSAGRSPRHRRSARACRA